MFQVVELDNGDTRTRGPDNDVLARHHFLAIRKDHGMPDGCGPYYTGQLLAHGLKRVTLTPFHFFVPGPLEPGLVTTKEFAPQLANVSTIRNASLRSVSAPTLSRWAFALLDAGPS